MVSLVAVSTSFDSCAQSADLCRLTLCAVLSTPSSQAASTTAMQSCTGLLMLHTAARLITGVRRNDHIKPTLQETLHWLPVSQHIIFKIVLMTYDFIRGCSPAYFRDVCVPVASVAFCSRLHSADRDDMIVPQTRTTRYGTRSFHVVAPQIWNSLPSHLKDINNSHKQFKLGLSLCSLCKPTHRRRFKNFVYVVLYIYEIWLIDWQ